MESDDIFIIDPALCTERVGHDSEQQCAAACPPEVCIPDPSHAETEAELYARAMLLCPDDVQKLNESTSHYRMA